MHLASNNFYYSTICHFCKEIPQKLQRCSVCKTVGYCSKIHQKLDWRYHKNICKVIACTNKNNRKNCSFLEWKNQQLCNQQHWATMLNRQLYPYECQMWMFPRVCAYCYSQSNLTDCLDCLNIAYCSKEHMKSHSTVHKQYCKSLRLCLDIDLYLAKIKEYPQIQLKKNFNIKLATDMHSLLDVIDNSATEDLLQNALKSEALTIASSILYVMGLLSFHPRKCVIHLVGASSLEGTTDWVLTSELLFHSIPDLTEIQYYLIGPEAWNISNDVRLCDSCNSSSKKFCTIVKTDLYHKVVSDIAKPDYILALNCGFHEFEDQKSDQWLDSIPFLVGNNTPLAFTSYTQEETRKDMEYIRKVIPDVSVHIIKSSNNPFSSLRPVRDCCSNDVPVFYSNAYISIIQKAKEPS